MVDFYLEDANLKSPGKSQKILSSKNLNWGDQLFKNTKLKTHD